LQASTGKHVEEALTPVYTWRGAWEMRSKCSCQSETNRVWSRQITCFDLHSNSSRIAFFGQTGMCHRVKTKYLYIGYGWPHHH
jgi:hypothetical protein